ncbi:hypothetical protein [Amycolatopsis albispora]|uniref:Uncharacterized protein n=1 Tax=Amycolatopsis albispora TaxID=1804986 RepID=A0A344LBD6_9PSEU|nr:hypothetical protein [Amycolatopsis albispora]AXB45360.1 hypothetical protein A4R43_25075 [Amycolatopsis albispora]
MNTHGELVRELRSLRKGRGVHAGRIGDRIGPNLRLMCGITGDDGPVTIREKLVCRLSDLAEQLPDDLRVSTVAAFGLTPEVRLPLYQDRIRWAATRIDRDARTVRRRVDDAIDQLAELVATIPSAPAGAWRTVELHVVVTLDSAYPEVLEHHRILVDQDGLHEVELASPLAVGHEVDVLYGGTLLPNRLALALPEPLPAGSTHDFAVRFRLPRREALGSYVVQEPCDLFDLRVRFGRDQRPPHVWTLRDVRQHTGPERGSPQPVDRAGDVHLRFRRLLPGLRYGARWDPAHGSNEGMPTAS